MTVAAFKVCHVGFTHSNQTRQVAGRLEEDIKQLYGDNSDKLLSHMGQKFVEQI